MSRLTRSFPIALTLALGLGAWSCAVPPASIMTQPARVGSASLMLLPRVIEHPAAQAVVTRPTAASIARLDVIPMIETSEGVFQPFKADGSPTAIGSQDAVMASQSGPTLRLGRRLRLSGLAGNTSYRILARAFDAQGKLLSQDADSTVTVRVEDDAPQSPKAIPVTLADVPFAARTTITLSNGQNPDYATVVTSLYTVSGGIQVLVPGSTQTLTKAQMPMTLTLDGLTADTDYLLDASLRDASDTEVAAETVEIAVTNDDTPAPETLALNVPTGVVSLAGGVTPIAGYVNAKGTDARFNLPYGIVVGQSGNLYVTDYFNRAVRQITTRRVVSTLAGGNKVGGYFKDGTGTDAHFYMPIGIATDKSGNFYVADTGNRAIRKITPEGVVTLFAGMPGMPAALVNGAALNQARFGEASGVAVHTDGTVYVADTSNHSIREISPQGLVSTLAGGGSSSASGFADGNGASARFNSPSGIAVDLSGNIYVTDYENHTIRKITSSGVVSTIAGGGSPSAKGYVNAKGTAARFERPYGIAVDLSGNIYVADSYNHAIRKITPAGDVSTFAGGGPSAPGYVDAPRLDARIKNPLGVAVDAAGNVYVADTANHAIRKIIL